ncbi:MAG TPA: hypothetical protein VGD46_11815, partial [Rhizobacter sp.]
MANTDAVTLRKPFKHCEFLRFNSRQQKLGPTIQSEATLAWRAITGSSFSMFSDSRLQRPLRVCALVGSLVFLGACSSTPAP